MGQLIQKTAIVIGLLSLFAGCSPQKPSTTPRQKTVQSVPSKIRPGATINMLENGDRSQVEDGKETAHYRKPTGQEIILQYWRQKYLGVPLFYEPVAGSGSSDGHVIPNYQLRIPSKGVTVIYDTQIDRVTEVIEYAPI